MEKGNAVPADTLAWSFIDQTVSRASTRRERRVEIGNPVADVVDAGSAPSEKLRDWPRGIAGREQFEPGGAELDRPNGRAIDGFSGLRLDAEVVAIKSERSVQIVDRDADVSDLGRCGLRHGAKSNRCQGPT